MNEDFIEYEDVQEELLMLSDAEYPTDIQERPICQQPDCDKIINAEVALQLNNSF